MVKISVIRGDIANVEVAAVVNAANSSLLGGGGVDGAIHRYAGPELLEACKIIRRSLPKGLQPGEAVITKGYNLPAKFVIHTVGPVFDSNKDQSAVLEKCFRNSLLLAEKHNAVSIAFPAISCGAYNYPKQDCALIAKRVIKNFSFNSIKEVVFCLYENETYEIFKKIILI